MEVPDNWVVLHLQIEGLYKVLCGWSGGYLDGDRWRMNSGIKSITEDDKAYYITGFSGSVYKCWKDQEVLRMNCAHVYDKIIKENPSIKIVPISEIIDIFKD